MFTDGWQTGDVGEWVDGTHVKIVDRIKHIIITSGKTSPRRRSRTASRRPRTSKAMVMATAAISDRPDRDQFDTVGDWAADTRSVHRIATCPKPEVIELIRKSWTRRTEFARVENIRKFRLLPRSSTTKTVS